MMTGAPHQPAPKPVLRRKTGIFESQWPWFVLAGMGSLTFFGVAGLVLSGAVSLDGGNNLRGYTVPGILLGVMAVLLTGLTLLFSIRKRAMQESMPLRGTMMGWLWVHVYAGLLALCAATLHGGFGLWSGSLFSSGKILYFTFFFLAMSGVAWRLAYRFVPPAAAPQIHNYSQTDAQKRAEQQLTEIEKIAAGKSDGFHTAKAQLLAAPTPQMAQMIAMQFAQQLPPQERGELDELLRLAQSRSRALARVKLQEKYAAKLQGWRKWHVPLFVFALLLLPVHLIGAFDVQKRTLPPSVTTSGPLTSYEAAADCKDCHKQIYDQWSASMHAHALSATTITQNNQDLKTTLKGKASPDPLFICVNCHAPTGSMMARQAQVPFPEKRMNDGVDCVSCHSFDGKPHSAGGGWTDLYLGDMKAGKTFFGPFDDPVGNGFHKSEFRQHFKDADADGLCLNCHDVNADLNGDGKIVKGVDLVLQQTDDEYQRYRKGGGKETCVSCHMPIAKGNRAADGARVPLDQDMDAPNRVLHDHGFIGVDYPLDEVAKHDPQKGQRAALLQSAARLRVDPELITVRGKKGFNVEITNSGGAHNIPTGFAFARQMWLEVKVNDANGVLLQSGVLARNTDDLCDASTMNDVLRPNMEGCNAVDEQLVNLQQKLVDVIVPVKSGGVAVLDDVGDGKIETAPGGHETVLQDFRGGPVPRTRPVDGKLMPPILFNTTRVFSYEFERNPVGDVNVSVRLLFRNLPPYFVKTMGKGVTPPETPLIPLIPNLQIVEMASSHVILHR